MHFFGFLFLYLSKMGRKPLGEKKPTNTGISKMKRQKKCRREKIER